MKTRYRALLSAICMLSIDFLEAQVVSFESSNLPVIVINTNGQTIKDEPKVNVSMGIIDNGNGNRNFYRNPSNGFRPDAFNNFEGTVGIEYRGSSSQSFPKKPYGFETRRPNSTEGKAFSLLGMPSENDWILNATYNDKSLLRDVLAYHLSNQIGMYATRTRYVELVLNNDYQGIYILMERIKQDPNRVNIAPIKPQDNSGDALTGGYILKIDKSTGSPSEMWKSPYPANNNMSTYILVHHPKPKDITPAQFSYIQNHITQFEHTLKSPLFKDPTEGYAKFIDIDTFVDYFLLSELTHNPDAFAMSTFFYKDRDSRGGKIKMGPAWDYNHAFGNANYCLGGEPDNWVYETTKLYCRDAGSQVPFWWERLLEDKAFCIKLRDRWQQLRQGPWTYQNMEAFIEQNTSLLQEAQARNFARWPSLGQYVWPNRWWGNTHREEVNYLKDWIQQRLSWMDTHIKTIGALQCEEVALPTATSALSYCQGETAPALTAQGSQLKWYADATTSQFSSFAPVPNTQAVGRTSYFVSQSIEGCESKRLEIQVTTQAKPSRPTTTTTIDLCQGQAATPLTATGSNLKWYQGDNLLNTAPTPNTSQAGSVVYAVSQTINGCESDRRSVNVNVKSRPAPPQATATVEFCQGQAASPLTATGSELKWYQGDNLLSTTPTPNTSQPGSVVYAVSQTINGCESERRSVNVNIKTRPASPTATPRIEYTQGQPAAPLSAQGSELRWFSNANTTEARFSPPTPSTEQVGTTLFFVSQTVQGCESRRTQIEVIVKPPTAVSVCLSLKLLLEGAMNGNEMSTTLRQMGVLPGQLPLNGRISPTPAGQPYHTFGHNVNETVNSYAADVVDWVLVSLRTSPTDASSTIYRAAMLLHKDGTVKSVSGCPVLNPTQSFFVAVEHRNHLGVVSDRAISVVNNQLTYDFTQRQSFIPAGSPAVGQLLNNGVYCLYAGDPQKSPTGEINATDANIWRANNGRFGVYHAADFNLDGEINAKDETFWRRNNGRFSGVRF
ncbi:MAG: CotH kinase family protein [Runella sp.]